MSTNTEIKHIDSCTKKRSFVHKRYKRIASMHLEDLTKCKEQSVDGDKWLTIHKK